MVKRTLLEEQHGIDELLKFVDVDVNTGMIRWSCRLSNRTKIGDVAGSDNGKGYTQIRFDGKMYLRHRIIFYVANGYLPKVVDHKNGVSVGDGIDNLQEATHQQNLMKMKVSIKNTSGYPGVTLHKNGKWRSQIRINGKKTYLGLFDTAKEASDAYERKARETFGDFYVPYIEKTQNVEYV